LRFRVEVGEEVEEVFGTIFLSAVGEELDGFPKFLSAGVVGVTGSSAGGVVAVEHCGDFQ
jgi:hypothetical protein